MTEKLEGKDNISSHDQILCLICMNDFKQSVRLEEIGIKLFFCEKHYPKQWEDRTP